MKRMLCLSIILNLLLLGAIAWAVQKLGGFSYAWHRFRNPVSGIYQHRLEHFATLPARPGSIVFLGDSQVAQAEWHEMFSDNPAVLNRGISGDYIKGTLDRLDEILRHKPLKIFLLIGTNDLVSNKKTSESETGYHNIVQRIRSESPDTELFLLSLFPVNTKLRDFGLDNQSVQAFNQKIQQIARDFALPYVDLNKALSDAEGNLATAFTNDGIHINGRGYERIKEQLAGYFGH